MNVFSSLFALALGGEISGLIETSGLVAKTVLVILLIFSLGSWAIIFSKWGLFRRARAQSNRFIRMFRKSERLNEVAAVVEQFKPSPLVAVFEGAYGELRKQTTYPIRMTALQRATQIACSEELTRLESRLPWLATIGWFHLSSDCSERSGASSTHSMVSGPPARQRCVPSRPASRKH